MNNQTDQYGRMRSHWQRIERARQSCTAAAWLGAALVAADVYERQFDGLALGVLLMAGACAVAAGLLRAEG